MIQQQLDSLVNIINKAITESLSNTHTSTIAKVTKISGATISAKPVFKRVVNNVDVELPEFSEIPVFTLQGGNNYRIMPISVGDYAILIFNERCIDDWFIGNADNKRPREFRMHDYSDAIALVGLNKLSNGINIPSDYEEVNGDIVHTGNNTQTGDYDITGDITQEGDNTINNGTLFIPSSSDVNITTSSGNISLRDFMEATKDHVHSQGDDGNGDSEVDTDVSTTIP